MDFNKIKVGEILSTTMYMEVLSKSRTGITVKDNQNRTFEINGVDLINSTLQSSSQFDAKILKVTKTELAQRLTEIGDSVFTVHFIKQTGEPRTLIGYKLSSENLMGRINVIDLEIKTGHPIRQVDLREVKWLIYQGVKYVVK